MNNLKLVKRRMKIARKVDVAYEKMRARYPEADDEEMQSRVGNHLFKRKLLRAAVLFPIGACMIISLSHIPSKYEGTRALIGVVGPVSEVVSVALIAKVLHDFPTYDEEDAIAKRVSNGKGDVGENNGEDR